MPTARVTQQTIEGVAGFRFLTNADPDTEHDSQLRRIQRELAGGIVDVPVTSPHLNFYDVMRPDAADHTYISLWVPLELEARARELLAAADFEVI